jgi:GNAT superfamily N-acetyltransferase
MSNPPNEPRPAELGPGDYDALLRLWEAAGLPCKPRGRDSREQYLRQLSLGMLAFLGLFDDRRLVGVILVTNDGRKGWLNRLAVAPSHRRRGLGRRLIAAAEDWLRERGIRIFACQVEGYNDVSRVVFRRCGYQLFEDIEYYTKRPGPDW